MTSALPSAVEALRPHPPLSAHRSSQAQGNIGGGGNKEVDDMSPFHISIVISCLLPGVRGAGPVPADPEEAPAEGLQGRLPPLPPHPEHPRLPGREGVYDGPHGVHERNALHSTTGNTHTGLTQFSTCNLWLSG